MLGSVCVGGGVLHPSITAQDSNFVRRGMTAATGNAETKAKKIRAPLKSKHFKNHDKNVWDKNYYVKINYLSLNMCGKKVWLFGAAIFFRRRRSLPRNSLSSSPLVKKDKILTFIKMGNNINKTGTNNFFTDMFS